MSDHLYATVNNIGPLKQLRMKSTQSKFDKRSIIQGSISLWDVADSVKVTDKPTMEAISIAVTAFVLSKIKMPILWKPDTIDHAITLGHSHFKQWSNLDCFQVENIPNVILFDGYRFELSLTSNKFQGKFNTQLSHMCSDISRCIIEFFKSSKGTILQIGEFAFAIWQKHAMYYLFDPYSRDFKGQFNKQTDIKGYACMSMNTTLEAICELLYNNLVQMAVINSQFYLTEIRCIRVDKMDTNKYNQESNRPIINNPIQSTDQSNKVIQTSAQSNKFIQLTAQPIKTMQQSSSIHVFKNSISCCVHERNVKIPQNDLSALSVVGGKKKRRAISQPNISQNEIENQHMPDDCVKDTKSILEMCETNLNTVIDAVIEECWLNDVKKG